MTKADEETIKLITDINDIFDVSSPARDRILELHPFLSDLNRFRPRLFTPITRSYIQDHYNE